MGGDFACLHSLGLTRSVGGLCMSSLTRTKDLWGDFACLHSLGLTRSVGGLCMSSLTRTKKICGGTLP